ncbi:MAG: hypothetical protein MAG795_00242 [Candidatus Woesearchaeota archaeon]|nr:hypothetical protein [Candidatus Woesearchaeota archaeon]
MSGILIFEISMILVSVGIWFYMKKNNYKNILQKMLVLFIAVLLFEIMSEPMWRNFLLHRWTFIYHDVSWIITLGWVNIFMVSMLLVDKLFSKYTEKAKFWLYLLFVTIITTPIEVILLNTGIRGYDAVLTSTMTGITIPFTSAPIEIIMVIPIIAALIIPFYKIMLNLFKLD